MTDLRSSWSVYIPEDPPAGATFITFIRSQPSDFQRSVFEAALASDGLQMTALAYVMEVAESLPVTRASETIQMDVERSWVSQNGGVNAVRIISLGEDGLARILDTRFSNYALDTGHMNFRAIAHSDSFLFALISVKAAPVIPVSPDITPTATVPTVTVPGTTSVPPPISLEVMAIALLLAAIILIVFGLVLNRRVKKG
ncbi:MAG: hypothetical protein ACM3X8_05515 [Methanomicrobiales archaeon]